MPQPLNSQLMPIKVAFIRLITEDGKFELTENEHDMNRVIYWLGQGTSKIRSDDADFGSDRISRTKSKAEKSIIREETGKLEKF